MLKFLVVLAVLTAALWIDAGSATLSRPAPQRKMRSILEAQWTIFQRHWGVRRGLSLRIDTNGKALAKTTYIRNLTLVDASPGKEEMLLTLEYDNLAWSNGRARRRFLYRNRVPPVYGVEVYENGTVSTTERTGVIIMYPRGYGFWASASVSVAAPLFAVENFIVHPLKQSVRMDVLFVYFGMQFSYTSFSREAGGTTRYPTKFFTNAKESRVLTGDEPEPYGPWATVTGCTTPSYKFTRKLAFVKGSIPAVPSGEDRVALQLPDGVTVSVPKTVGPTTLGKTTILYLQWSLGGGAVLRKTTEYGPHGNFVRDCTTTFYRVLF